MRLEYAISDLNKCNLTNTEKSTINGTLNNAYQVLRIKGDYSKAKILFDNTADKLVQCPVISFAPPAVQSPDSSAPFGIFGIIFLFAVISVVFAFLWYRSGKSKKAPTQ